MPELAFQIDHLLFVLPVAVQVADNDFVLIVAIQTAIEDFVNIHNCHVVPPLCLIVNGNTFLAVLPPVVFCVVVGRFDFQNRNFPVWQADKVVYICQHEGILRMLEHLFDLEYFQPGFLGEDLGDQRFQQMPHFQRYPVACIIDSRSDV